VERTERTVDRDANQALWARFADVQGRYLRMRDGLADLQRQLCRLQVTVSSDDELVTATVDARGQLTALQLSPRAYRENAPRELAATITATVRRASGLAVDQVTGLISAYLPHGASAMDFVRTGDFSDLLRRQDASTGYPPDVHSGQ
jgi:DNA-binding protein YbaB